MYIFLFSLVLQAHGSVELSSFTEGYFLQHMHALLEKEGFRSLLLAPPTGARPGPPASAATPLAPHTAAEELEATLARRLRSLYVTSRV